jgi:molecular chaperone DnaK
VPQIEVTLDIDANGILNVSAKDKATGKEQKVQITHSSGLAKDEVEKMVRAAKENEAADKARRELVEVKNQAESQAYNAEKMLKENREKLSATAVTDLEAALKGLNEVREGQDKDAIKGALDRLQQVSYKVAEEMYKATGGAPGEGAPPPPGADAGAAPGSSAKPKDDVVDAEFRQS